MFNKMKKCLSRVQSGSDSRFNTFAVISVLTVCLILEIFAFNAHYFAARGSEIINASGLTEENIELNQAEQDPQTNNFILSGNGSVNIKNIDKQVTVIYLDVDFGWEQHTEFTINYGDEEHSNRHIYSVRVHRDIENSKYIPLHSFGNTQFVKIISSSGVQINNIILNKPLPFKFNWGRFFLFSAIFLAVIFIIRNKPFKTLIRENSPKQSYLFSAVSFCMVIYLFILMLFSSPYSRDLSVFDNIARDGGDAQYSQGIVDALIDKQLHLNMEPSEALKSLDDPYDGHQRSQAGVYWEGWDLAYYNGKFYSYFGIVQVLTLSLPYKLLTNSYISTRVSVFLFASGAAVFLMLIWRQLALRFMKRMSVGMFTLGQIAVVMCSMLTFLTSRPRFYEVAGTSALFYTAMGLWFLLDYAIKWESGGKGTAKLFFGCLSMALAVGCRPNFLLASLLVPLILYERIKENFTNKQKKPLAAMLAAIIIPYATVGSALMWYNYARFDSVFEFGNTYMLTVTNVGAAGSLSLMSRIALSAACIFCFIVPALNFSSTFPFITVEHTNISESFTGYIYKEHVLGILALPIMVFLAGIVHVFKVNNNYETSVTVTKRKGVALLPFPSRRPPVPKHLPPRKRHELRKRRRAALLRSLSPQTHNLVYTDRQHRLISRLVVAMPLIGILQMVVVSFIGIATRYQLDFFWLFSLPALICGYFIYESILKSYPKFGKAAKTVVSGIILASIILMLILTLSSTDGNWFANHNPAIYHRILNLFGRNR